MRKAMSVAFMLLLSVTLVGCGSGSTSSISSSYEPESVSVSASMSKPQQSIVSSSTPQDSSSVESDAPVSSDITVSNVLRASEPVALSSEDVAAVQALLAQYDWRSDEPTSDCIYDCLFSMFGEDVYYHSDCGTLSNRTNDTRIFLEDADRDSLNLILQKYVDFGLVPPLKED